MAFWRVAGFGVLVLLGVAIAVLRGADAWRQEAVVARLHVPPAFVVARDFDFGRYRLSWNGQGFAVHARNRPEKVLWSVDGGFLAAGRGVGASGRELLCRKQSLEAFETLGRLLQLKGRLGCDDGSLTRYVLGLEDDGERGLILTVSLDSPRLNRLYLSWWREPGEGVFGLGQGGDLTGRRLALPAGEGVPAFYTTSALRAFHSQSAADQVFDLRHPGRVGLEVHEGRLSARIYQGDSPQQLREHRASVIGPLPRQAPSK